MPALKVPFLIVAAILFLLGAIPPVPYAGSLVALGLLFFTLSALVG